MGLVSGIVVYLCIWWTVIFCILPIGIQRDDSEDPTSVGPGAPKEAYIKQKFIATTLVSALLWIVVYILIDIEIINFREIVKEMSVEGS